MTAVDADELLERIRRARDWAREREATALTGSQYGPIDKATAERFQGLVETLNGVIHRVVANVLDEIIQPSGDGHDR